MMRSLPWHRFGAVLYVLWGLLHIAGGAAIMMEADAAMQVAMQATASTLVTY